MYESDIKGKYDYSLTDTFMGFHCGNTACGKLVSCEMKYQKIMARSLPIEVTNGTLEGDIVPGDITFYRLQSTSDAKLRAYVAEGEVLDVPTRSFGTIGIFAIKEMGRFYRNVLVEKNYPHHGAVVFGHYGKTLFESSLSGRSDRGSGLQPSGGSTVQARESVCVRGWNCCSKNHF